MLNSKTDYIFVIIFFIVVATFLGMSIVNIIDKKLSNIKINIPKIKLPTSEVIVNFEKNGNNYKVKCNKSIKNKDKKQIKGSKKSASKKDRKKSKKKEEKILKENEYDKKDKDLSFSDFDSEIENKDVEVIAQAEEDNNDFEDDIEVDNDIDIDERLTEGMTGLTAEQFYNKNFINPYTPDYKSINNNDVFMAYNINDYQ